MIPRSNALRWAVAAPRGTVYLTGLQWSLYWLLSRPRRRWLSGDVTLAKLSAVTGSSRGRCWHALTRLRSLELVSWRAYPVMELDRDRRPRRYSPGCRGRLLVWIPRGAKRRPLVSPVGRRGATGNDSVSGPFGAWITREGLAASLHRRMAGNARSGSSTYGGSGPRPAWKGPPRAIYSRCPAGHRLRVTRRSWALGPSWAPSIEVRYDGECSTCRAPATESIRVAAAPPLPRALSPAELRDPPVLAARIAAAGLELERRGIHPGIREQLRRDYTGRQPGGLTAPPAAPAEPVGAIVGRIIPGSRATRGEGKSERSPGDRNEGAQ